MILKHTAKGGLGAKKMIAAKDWFENYGAIAVFTGRLLPGVELAGADAADALAIAICHSHMAQTRAAWAGRALS